MHIGSNAKELILEKLYSFEPTSVLIFQLLSHLIVARDYKMTEVKISARPTHYWTVNFNLFVDLNICLNLHCFQFGK